MNDRKKKSVYYILLKKLFLSRSELPSKNKKKKNLILQRYNDNKFESFQFHVLIAGSHR